MPLTYIYLAIAAASALVSGGGVWYLQGLRSDSKLADVRLELEACRSSVALQNQSIAGFAVAAARSDERAAEVAKRQERARKELADSQAMASQIAMESSCSSAMRKAWQ